MRIVFMGTPDFAAESLKKLYDSRHDIAAVYTQPDKPKNRGHKLTPSPVKVIALEHGTPVYQPATLKNADVIAELRGLKPDLIAVVAYGKLLPKDVLDIPRCGCINIHGSLLPKYRGAAPIQWSVLNGDWTTGVTSMYMAEKLDSGDIIAQVAIPIEPLETSGELYERLAVVGAKLLDATLDAIENGNAKRIPQNENKTCYAPPLTKEMSPIDWNGDFRKIINQIHGLNPWPVASADIGGNQLKIYRAEPLPSSGAPVGTASAEKNGIRVAALGGDVLITEIQAAGGKRMRASDYLRGHPLDV